MRRLSADELRAARKAQDWSTLWEASLPIVKFAISSLVRGGLDRRHCTEDTLQEASLAAGRAVRTWDPAEGEFSTWIMRRAQGAVLNHLAKERAGVIGFKGHAKKAGTREGGAVVFQMHEESTPDLEEKTTLSDMEAMETAKHVRQAWSHLEDILDFEIVGLRFGLWANRPEPRTMAAVAKAVGLPLRSVERRYQHALRQMAGFIEREGYFIESQENAA